MQQVRIVWRILKIIWKYIEQLDSHICLYCLLKLGEQLLTLRVAERRKTAPVRPISETILLFVIIHATCVKVVGRHWGFALGSTFGCQRVESYMRIDKNLMLSHSQGCKAALLSGKIGHKKWPNSHLLCSKLQIPWFTCSLLWQLFQ